MPTVADVMKFLEKVAPLTLAAEWDNVGLLLGDSAREVRRVMTCLTVTPESAAEAVREKADLLVSHHPILFRPVPKLTAASTEGRMLLDLVRAGASVYSPHTAYDNAPGGINDGLARRLRLTNVRSLRSLPSGSQTKLVVFVPDKDLAKVSDALFAAGAGRIGEYRECSYRLSGTGTFFATEATNPTIGTKGRREDVAEWRLEVVCPTGRVAEIVRAMRSAHSYEEPAFDLYPLTSDPTRHGQGRIGVLPALTTLAGAPRPSSRRPGELGADGRQRRSIDPNRGDRLRSGRRVPEGRRPRRGRRLSHRRDAVPRRPRRRGAEDRRRAPGALRGRRRRRGSRVAHW